MPFRRRTLQATLSAWPPRPGTSPKMLRAPRSAPRASSRPRRRERRNAALARLAELLGERGAEVLEANAGDLADERAAGLTEALRDRLTLTADRIAAMAEGVRAVAALEDPVGELIEERTLASGLELREGPGAARRRRGDLRGAPERDRRLRRADAEERQRDRASRLELRRPLQRGPRRAGRARRSARPGCPRAPWSSSTGRTAPSSTSWPTAEGLVDLIIPRGGEGLKEALKAVATVPVMYAAAGNCHVYVHADADLEMARRIAYNAKVQRPGVCNAAETLLVHAEVAGEFLPAVLADLHAAGRRAGRRRAGAALRAGDAGRRGDARRTGTPSTSG